MFIKPLIIENLSLEFAHKICFEGFSTQIPYGSRIAIIGNNGSGKSSLLKMISGETELPFGKITGVSPDKTGYVPQTPSEEIILSGGEYFWQSFSRELFSRPDLLILDEPTNHLDRKNRQKLLKLLNQYTGTLIIATHDESILDQCVDTIWHIDEGMIRVFQGKYSDYKRERALHYHSQNKRLSELNREKKKLELAQKKNLLKNRKSEKRESRDNNKMGFGIIVNRAQQNSEKMNQQLSKRIQMSNDELKKTRVVVEVIKPSFFIKSGRSASDFVLSISSGWCGYTEEEPILSEISLSLAWGEKFALLGDNGSGKTTFLQALLRHPKVICGGDWQMPGVPDIGYLDQHYSTLDPSDTVEGAILKASKGLNPQEVRKHLNRFLFKKNEEVASKVSTLSGGEKARLSLAIIAINTPRLLLLDEITNNVDMETKNHMLEVLEDYPGTMIIISHEQEFLEQLPLTGKFEVKEGKMIYRKD